jgi:hypothetical protein
MKVKDIIIRVLALKSTLYILLVSWVGVLVFSTFMIPPSDDGFAYFEPAMAFLHNKVQWGIFNGDDFNPFFIGFPTFSIAQFIFLLFTSLIKIPINLYTYRIFHMVLIFTLIVLTVHLLYLYLYRIKKSDYIIKSNLFLVLLSITPFAQQCWQVRPEVFGDVLIVISLVFFCYWKIYNKNIFYYFSALFLGLGAAAHPNFMVVAGILTIVIIVANFIKGNRLQSVLFGCVASIPVLLIGVWFLVYYPESVQEFRLQVGHHTGLFGGIKRLFAEALMLGDWQSNYIKLFYFIFWFPLLAILVATFALILMNIKKISNNNTINMLLLPMLISIIIIMIMNRGDDSYFVIYSFFIALVFVLVVRSVEQPNIQHENNKRLPSVLVLLCLILMVFMHTAVHSAKIMFSSKKYYNAPAVYKAITNSLNPDDTLFITSSRRLPVFYDYVEAKYRDDSSFNDIFFVYAHPAFEYDKIILTMSLINKVENINHERTVWGLWKKSISFDRENMKLVWRNKCQPKKFNFLDLHFNIESIIYEDKDHLFIRPKMITFEGDKL